MSSSPDDRASIREECLAQLRRGQRPNLWEMARQHQSADDVLVELVRAELGFRLEAGEAARVEEYLDRFPVLAQRHEAVFELICVEFSLRVRHEPGLNSASYHERFPQFAARLAIEASTLSHQEYIAPTFSNLPPVVPGYEIVGVLGRGGMGVVYKARQIALNRFVALKVMQGAADPERLIRFRGEAAALARLEHANIVHVYDVELYEGRPCIAMEFVEGGSLAEKLTRTRQPPRKAAEMAAVLARAMQASHDAGIVHRDLKPANVLVTLHGTLKVTDFGLAKHLDADSGQTQTGQILGTPSYMAPEQARGEASAIGPATDVYAIGAVLYEMLTGAPPFRGSTMVETLQLVCARDPTPPRLRGNGVPQDVETICLKCLQKHPADRYSSAEALAEDLERYLRDEPILARPMGRGERVRRWVQRRPALVAMGALGLGAVVIALTVLGHLLAARKETATAHAKTALEERRRLSRQLCYKAVLESFPQFELEAGLLLLARSLEAAPPEDEMLVRSISRQLLAWGQVCDGITLWHPTSILAAAVSPDERIVAIACEDNTVHLWNGETGQPLGDPLRPSGGASALAFSPDGKMLATGGTQIQIWDSRTWKLRSTWPDHHARVARLEYAREGNRLLVASGPEVVGLNSAYYSGFRVFDASTGKKLWDAVPPAVKGSPPYFCGCTFSPDGQRLWAGMSWTSGLLCFNAANGQSLDPPISERHEVFEIQTGSDGNSLLYNFQLQGGRTAVRLSKFGGNGLMAEFPPLSLVAFPPGGKSFWASHQLNNNYDQWDALMLWEEAKARPLSLPQPLPELWHNRQHQDPHTGFSAGIRGQLLVTWRGKRARLRRISPQPDPRVSYLELSGSPGVQLSRDGRYLLTFAVERPARPESGVELFDLTNSTRLAASPTSRRPVTGIAFHSDGNLALLADADGAALFWSMRENDPRPAWRSPPTVGGRAPCAAIDLVGNTAAISSDGRFGLTREADRCHLWDVATGDFIRTIVPHRSALLLSAGFSTAADSILAVTPSAIERWDLEGNLVKTELDRAAHTRSAFQSAFVSPNGRRTLLFPALDIKPRLFDVETQRVTDLSPEAFLADGASFSTDGDRVAILPRNSPSNPYIWDISHATRIQMPPRTQSFGGFKTVALSYDGTRIAVSEGWQVLVREVSTGREVASFRTSRSSAVLAFHPQLNRLLAGGGQYVGAVIGKTAVDVWDVSTLQRRGPTVFIPGEVKQTVLSPDGRSYVACTTGVAPGARLYDVATGKPGPPLPPLPLPSAPLEFTSDGQSLVIAAPRDSDTEIQVQDVASGSLRWQSFVVSGTVTALALGEDGQTAWCAVQGQPPHFEQWNLRDGKRLQAFPSSAEPGSEVSSLRIVGSGELIAAESELSSSTRPVFELYSIAQRELIASDDNMPPAWGRAPNAVTPTGDLHPVRMPELGNHFSEALLLKWTGDRGVTLGPPLIHAGKVFDAVFLPGGKELLTATIIRPTRTANIFSTSSGVGGSAADLFGEDPISAPGLQLCRWPIAQAQRIGAQRLRLWVETITGAELDERGELRPLDTAAVKQKRDALATLGGPPEFP